MVISVACYFMALVKVLRHVWKVGRELDQKQKKETTEGATGLGRITRQQTERWNQMIALRFQTGVRYQKIPASLRALQLGAITSRNFMKHVDAILFSLLS